MANASVVTAFIEGGCACMAVRVEADTTVTHIDPVTGKRTVTPAAVEYIGRVPMLEPIRTEKKTVKETNNAGEEVEREIDVPILWANLTEEQQEKELIRAAKEERDRRQSPPTPKLPKISGTLSI